MLHVNRPCTGNVSCSVAMLTLSQKAGQLPVSKSAERGLCTPEWASGPSSDTLSNILSAI